MCMLAEPTGAQGKGVGGEGKGAAAEVVSGGGIGTSLTLTGVLGGRSGAIDYGR